SAQAGQRLWSSRFGDLTAIRIGAALGASLQKTQADFQRRLLEKIPPAQVGFVFQPVKAQGLEAASGATDFSMLFIGFSLFLIVSAALLVGLLFRLGVEQRASEIGILLATGYPIAAVRRRFMREGGLLAGLGGVIGLGGAMVYTWLLMVGLRTWWLAGVGTPFLSLHINPLSLLIGYLIAIVVISFSIGWTVRQFGKVPARALLDGVTVSAAKTSGRLAWIFGLVSLALAGGLILFALVSGTTGAEQASPLLFFGSGALLLIAGLSFFSLWLRVGKGLMTGFAMTARMGARNSARHPGRSMLCGALVSCACFVIVAVGANRHVETSDTTSPQKESGAGGFALVADSDIPLHHDLNSEAGRFELGFSESDSAITSRAQIFPLRFLPGEDASCLNLYQPQKPRILGVPGDLIQRGGFQFQQTAATGDNPWHLLESELEPGVIPAIGDYNSVRWILHLGLGEDLIIQDELGQELRLRLVGLLRTSIFQSELLISEANFIKHFPSQSGYAHFLVQTPPEPNLTQQITRILENTLADYGFDVSATTEKLANYQAVENTYLATFQMLGGLGLLLGTLGLGIILLRNVIERSGELATLRAFGFRRLTLSMMLLAENGFLLAVGILIGSLSALLAVAPHLIAPGGRVPWFSLLTTLILVFLVGIISSAVAVFFALRRPLLPALKAE
ncbi:MAG: ABC transporter permease, partial [Candidatus Poribacteria bacterium]|nr:ABC transporter permease [Candidatus Poribacteria bacterium]